MNLSHRKRNVSVMNFRISTWMLGAFAVVGGVLSSCSNDDEALQAPEEPTTGRVTVTAGISNDGTRVALGTSENGKTKVLWSKGDAIALVSGESNYTFNMDEVEDATVAKANFTYEGTLPEFNADAYFRYPATLPTDWSVQPGTEAGLSTYMQMKATLPAGATGYENLNLTFAHETAVVKVDFTHSGVAGQSVEVVLSADGLLENGNSIKTEKLTADANGHVVAYLVVPATDKVLTLNARLLYRKNIYETTISSAIVAGNLYKLTRTEDKLVARTRVVLPAGKTFKDNLYKCYKNYKSCTHVKFEVNSTREPVSTNMYNHEDLTTGGKYYFVPDTGNKILYVCTPQDEIWANEDCSEMFLISSTSNGLTKITFCDEFKTDNVTNMAKMFSACKNVTKINGLENFKTYKVTSMSSMFASCEKLNMKLDLTHFYTNKVTDMMLMFNGCKSLTSLDISSFDFTLSPNVVSMFKNVTTTISVSQAGYDYLSGQEWGGASAEQFTVK